MLKKLLPIFCFVIAMSGCLKNADNTSSSVLICNYKASTVIAPASEVAYLQNYLSSRSIVAKKDTSGIFYSIDSVGAGTVTPDVCSTITITYSGNLLLADNSNPVFDSNLAGATFILGDLILGWQRGVPLIKKGGSITLYIPPSLGYGANAVGSIPANSYLRFKLQLVGLR